MAFINHESLVDVVQGRYAGRFGVVRRIRIEDETLAVFVFVDLFNPENGGMELMLFEPGHIKRRRGMTRVEYERAQRALQQPVAVAA